MFRTDEWGVGRCRKIDWASARFRNMFLGRFAPKAGVAMCYFIHQVDRLEHIFPVSFTYVAIENHFVEDKVCLLQVEHDVQLAHALEVLWQREGRRNQTKRLRRGERNELRTYFTYSAHICRLLHAIQMLVRPNMG